MANKKTSKNTVNNDFDIDSSYDFDGFDFEEPTVKDDRKPILRAAAAAGKGVKELRRDTDFIKRTLKKALPKGYGQSMDTSDKVEKTLRNLYDESAKEIKPAWREAKRAGLKLIPPDSKIVPKKLQSMFKRMRDEIDEEDRYNATGGQTDRRETEIASMLAQTTQASIEHSVQVEAERQGRDRLKEGMELSRHRDIMAMVTGTAVSADKIQKFQTNITLPVQKKMLELQMRTLFVLQDTVAFMKEDAQNRDKYLAAISKNTMLPDIVKVNTKEAKKAVAEQAWNQSLHKGLFGGRDAMIEKTLSHFSNMVLNQAKGLAEGLRSGTDLVQQGQDANEMMQGQDKYAIGGGEVGKFLGQKAIGWGAGKLNKALSSARGQRFGGKKIIAGGHAAANFNENIGHKLNDFRTTNKYLFDDSLQGGFMRILQGMLPNMGPDLSMKMDSAKDLDTPTMGTKRVNRSMTEVIPGYLARILREAQMARLGKNVELTTYNWASNKFSSRSRMEGEIFKSVINRKDASRTHEQLDELLKQIDPEGKLSPEAKRALKKKLLTNSTAQKEANLENLTSQRGFEGASDKAIEEATSTVMRFFQTIAPEKKAGFSRAHNTLATMVGDPREAIQRQADWGNMAYLKKMGFLTDDGKSVNMSKIVDYVLDPSNEPTVRKMADDPKGANMADTLKSHFEAAKDKAKTNFNQASAYAKDSYSKFSQMTPAEMAKATREGGMSLVAKAKGAAQDVYVAGEASPRLQAVKLIAGQYRDRLTKKIITTIDQIKGEVEDTGTGSVVVAKQDLLRLTYVAPDGQSLKRLEVTPLKEGFSSMTGVPTNIRDLTAMIRQQGQATLANAHAGPSDVYVAGEQSPRLIAAKMEAGAYTDAETGKVIRHETDIEGDVKDEEGQTVVEAMELPKLRVLDRRTGIMKPITFIAKVAMAIAKGTWWWQKKMWAWSKWNLKALKTVTMGTFNVARRIFGDPPRDVYVKGEPKPRLYAARMAAGDYRDRETGERIKHQSEIKGAVIDRDDQVVLEDNELDNLQVYNNVLRIFNPFKLVKWAGKKIGQFLWWGTKKIQSGGVALSKAMFKGMGKLVGLTARAKDVFVKGERKARLTAGLMKAGAYICVKTGKVIQTTDDIVGAVQTEIDGKMGTILSEDEFMRGLYGEDGKLLKGGVMATIGKGLGALNKLMSARVKLDTGVRGSSTKDILKSKAATAGDKTVALLQDIKGIFQKRFGDSADSDGDGLRDGSWQSLLKKKEGAAGTDAAKGSDKKDKDGSGGILGGLKSLLGFGKKKKDEDEDGYGIRDGLEDAANADELLEGRGRRGRVRGKGGRWGKLASRFGGARGLLKGAGAGVAMGAAAYGIDGLMGKAGVGKQSVDTSQDDSNWDQMSGTEKLESGMARATEKVGSFMFMDNMAAEARKTRVDKESAYLQEKASGRTPGKGLMDYLMMGNPISLGLGLASGTLGGGYKNTSYDQIRYVQYGFNAKNVDAAAKASAMEDYLMKFVKGGDTLTIDESKMDVDRLMQPWGLKASDPKQAQQFFGWYKNRFKPVFLVHLNAIKRFTGSTDLTGVGSIKKEQASSYVDAIRFPGGPYDYLQMPTESLVGVTGYAVTSAVEKAISDMGIKPGDGKTAAAKEGTLADKAQAGTNSMMGDMTKAAGSPASSLDWLKLGLDTPKKGESKFEMFASKLGKSDFSQAGDVNALDAARFRVYGLQTMEPGKVLSLRTLERVLQPDLKFQADGKAAWNGSTTDVMAKVQGAFGVSNAWDIDGQAWMNWFRQRFLPTYLAYMSSFNALTGKTDAAMADVTMKPADKVQVAKMLTGLSGVWDAGQSPWPGYTLANSDTDAKNNIDFLEKKVKEAQLQEQKATTASSSSSSSTSTSNTSWWQKSTSAVKDFFSPSKKEPDDKLAQVTSPDAETPSKGTAGVSPVSLGGGTSGISTPSTAAGQLADGRNADAFLSLKSGVTLEGMHPEFMKNFKGMVEEYGTLTGKKVNVNDAFRSYQAQVAAKKKYGNRAAAPGSSLHEFGLAMDIDTKTLDDLDKMGLMRKYGFTRPVGGEGWHMEPIGIQQDIAKYKKDQAAAAQAISSGVGRGGGGFGTVAGAAQYSRNKELSQSIYESKASNIVNAPETSNIANAVETSNIANAVETSNIANATVGGSVSAPPSVSAIPSGGRLGVDGASSAQFDGEAKPQGGGGAGPGAAAQGTSGIANAPNNAMPADPTVKVPDAKGNGYAGMKDTITAAAKMVGVDPDMMIRMAAIESSFNASAQAGTSSAAGLFQFTKGTWRSMIDKYGRKYGFDINTQPTDPKAASILAAHLVKDSEKQVAPKISRPFGATEAYIAHFLGPGGAVTLLQALDKNPGASAAEIMPKAAAANRSIFYDGGRARTVQEVYALLNNKVNSKIAQFGVPNVTKSNAALAKAAGAGGADDKSVDGPGVAAGAPPMAPTGAQPTSMASVPTASQTAAPAPTTPGATESAPMSDAYGIRPAQEQQRATPQGQPMQMDPAVFAPTNDILTQQLDVQRKMLTTLESILAAATAGGTSGDAAKAAQGAPSAPSRTPYSIPKVPVPMRRQALT